MDNEVEIDDLFKSTGTISMTDGNESERVQKKSLCDECGQEFEASTSCGSIFNPFIRIGTSARTVEKPVDVGSNWRGTSRESTWV